MKNEESPEEVSLLIEDEVFSVDKNELCQFSDYFRAMFSGSYIENEKKEISIDVVDAKSMKIILQYVKLGFIDLGDYSLVDIGDLAVAANFLQIPELIKQIKYWLECRLDTVNWVEIMTIAQNASYTKLEQYAVRYGLFKFKSMEPQHISSIQTLFWYLSHPYLDTDSELQVFKYGVRWVDHYKLGADALLIILCCLDMSRLKTDEIIGMQKLMTAYFNSLAEKILYCLYKLSRDIELSVDAVIKNKLLLCETFSERVYAEVLNLIKENHRRKLQFTAAIPFWSVTNEKSDSPPYHLYTFKPDKGLEKWLMLVSKHCWGWNILSWGLSKLVLVGGEKGRGTGMFIKNVRVYDTCTKTWTDHGDVLKSRRHAGAAILGDSLYLVGGVGGFRVVLDTAVVYDLNRMTYTEIANFPDAIQSPAVCTHENKLYVAGQKHVFRYEDYGEIEMWHEVLETDMRPKCMVSFKGYIYMTQNLFNTLYRFRPDVDSVLETIATLSDPAAGIVNMGDRLYFFSGAQCSVDKITKVEEYKGGKNHKVTVLYSEENDLIINDVSGCCAIVTEMPPVNPVPMSEYHKRHLTSIEYAIQVQNT